MSNEIVVKQNQSQEIIPLSKKELLRDMICKGASDNELTLFIENCNRTGLDPFQKQCWAVRRWDKSLGREVMTFQTGVDGFRVIANRSNKYAGQVGPMWCGDDGKWTDVWLKNMPPVAAKVGVLRSDFKEPLWAVARFSSYAAKTKDDRLTQFWQKMPDLMIAKVAECLALRKTFPQDLSGIYSQEEMEQADVVKDVTPNTAEEKKIVEEPPKAIVNHAPTPITYDKYVFKNGTYKDKKFSDIEPDILDAYMGRASYNAVNKELSEESKIMFALYELHKQNRTS